MKTFISACCVVLLFLMANPALAQNEWRDTITDIDRYQLIRLKGLIADQHIATAKNIITKNYGSASDWKDVWQAWQDGDFTNSPGGFSAGDSTRLHNLWEGYLANELYDDSDVLKYTSPRISYKYSGVESPEYELNINGAIRGRYRPEVRPIVTIIADDGSMDDLTWLRPITEAYGVNICHALVTDWIINPPSAGYMDVSDLPTLTGNGDEILAHTHTHADLNTLDSAQLYYEIGDHKRVMDSLGYPVTSIVAPFGNTNKQVRDMMRRFYTTNFVTQNFYINTPPINSYFITRFSLDNHTLDSAKRAVDEAVANNSWLVFAIHPGYAKWDNVNAQASIDSLLSYITDSVNVDVKTVSGALEIFANTFEQGDRGYDLNIITAPNYFAVGADGTPSWKSSTGSAILANNQTFTGENTFSQNIKFGSTKSIEFNENLSGNYWYASGILQGGLRMNDAAHNFEFFTRKNDGTDNGIAWKTTRLTKTTDFFKLTEGGIDILNSTELNAVYARLATANTFTALNTFNLGIKLGDARELQYNETLAGSYWYKNDTLKMGLRMNDAGANLEMFVLNNDGTDNGNAWKTTRLTKTTDFFKLTEGGIDILNSTELNAVYARLASANVFTGLNTFNLDVKLGDSKTTMFNENLSGAYWYKNDSLRIGIRLNDAGANVEMFTRKNDGTDNGIAWKTTRLTKTTDFFKLTEGGNDILNSTELNALYARLATANTFTALNTFNLGIKLGDARELQYNETLAGSYWYKNDTLKLGLRMNDAGANLEMFVRNNDGTDNGIAWKTTRLTKTTDFFKLTEGGIDILNSTEQNAVYARLASANAFTGSNTFSQEVKYFSSQVKPTTDSSLVPKAYMDSVLNFKMDSLNTAITYTSHDVDPAVDASDTLTDAFFNRMNYNYNAGLSDTLTVYIGPGITVPAWTTTADFMIAGTRAIRFQAYGGARINGNVNGSLYLTRRYGGAAITKILDGLDDFAITPQE